MDIWAKSFLPEMLSGDYFFPVATFLCIFVLLLTLKTILERKSGNPLDQLQSDLKNLREANQQTETKLEKQNKDLRDLVNQLQITVKRNKKEQDDLNKENTDLKARIDELEDKMGKIQKQLQEMPARQPQEHSVSPGFYAVPDSGEQPHGQERQRESEQGTRDSDLRSSPASTGKKPHRQVQERELELGTRDSDLRSSPASTGKKPHRQVQECEPELGSRDSKQPSNPPSGPPSVYPIEETGHDKKDGCEKK